MYSKGHLRRAGYSNVSRSNVSSVFASLLSPHRPYSTTEDHYNTLELPRIATIKEIKMQFKKLSKKYHPDLNPTLSGEEKEQNKERFMKILGAYEILKHKDKRKQYDQLLGHSPSGANPKRSTDWNNTYYGEAKYYSKSGSTSYAALGLNTNRHRVHYNKGADGNSHFTGVHINYGDRFDVPHFNYDEHLQKHLKFEQRILAKYLTPEEREQIMAMLNKLGKPLSEEVITKFLMRQVDHRTGNNYAKNRSSTLGTDHKAYMYQAPEDSGGAFKNLAIVGGALTSLYFVYSFIH